MLWKVISGQFLNVRTRSHTTSFGQVSLLPTPVSADSSDNGWYYQPEPALRRLNSPFSRQPACGLIQKKRGSRKARVPCVGRLLAFEGNTLTFHQKQRRLTQLTSKVPMLEIMSSKRPVLICYRLRSDILDARLPIGMQPRTVNGYAVGGIFVAGCPPTRTSVLPTRFVSQHHVVHFMNVDQGSTGSPREGLFVIRRDTSSRLHALIGQCRAIRSHHAHFRFGKRDDHTVDFEIQSDDQLMYVAVKGRLAKTQSPCSLFRSPGQAAENMTYAISRLGGVREERMKAPARRWHLQPLEMERIESSIFEDTHNFPAGSVTFDSAYSVHDVELNWANQPVGRAAGARTSLTFLQS